MAVINYLPLCFDECDKGLSCYLQIQTDSEDYPKVYSVNFSAVVSVNNENQRREGKERKMEAKKRRRERQGAKSCRGQRGSRK